MRPIISKMDTHLDQMVNDAKKKNIVESCLRCGGLLVGDRSYDLSASGVFKIVIQRCVQCGDVIDPMILKHRWQSKMNYNSLVGVDESVREAECG